MKSKAKDAKSNRRRRNIRNAINTGVFVSNTQLRDATDELRKGAEAILRDSKRMSRCTAAQKAGHAAENFHAATFNCDAKTKGLKVRAKTTSSLGLKHAPDDIRIFQGTKLKKRVQVKYCRNSTRTYGSVSQKKYEGMDIVVPSNQVGKIKKMASKGVKLAVAKNRKSRVKIRAHVRDNTSAKISFGNAKSQKLSSREARKVTRDPNRLRRRADMIDLEASLSTGAKSGLLVGAAVGTFKACSKLKKGQISYGEAITEIGLSAAKSSAKSAADAGIHDLTSKLLVKSGAKFLAKGGGCAAVVQVGMGLACDAHQMYRGKMSVEEAAKSTLKNSVRAGAGWAGTAMGASLGSAIPVLGTAIGAAVVSYATVALVDLVIDACE